MRLGQRGDGGVVVDEHRHVQALAEQLAQRHAAQGDVHRRAGRAGLEVDHRRDPEADGLRVARGLDDLDELVHQRVGARQLGLLEVRLGEDAVLEDGDRDFCTADVDADQPFSHCDPPYPRKAAAPRARRAGRASRHAQLSAPSVPLSQVGRAAHDLGLAGMLGGTLFGRLALHPAVAEISDPRERGKVVNAAWRRYGAVNGAGRAAVVVAAGPAPGPRRRATATLTPPERRLARAKDGSSASSRSPARRARWRACASRARRRAARCRCATATTPRAPRRTRRLGLKQRLNALGLVTLAAEAALVGRQRGAGPGELQAAGGPAPASGSHALSHASLPSTSEGRSIAAATFISIPAAKNCVSRAASAPLRSRTSS